MLINICWNSGIWHRHSLQTICTCDSWSLLITILILLAGIGDIGIPVKSNALINKMTKIAHLLSKIILNFSSTYTGSLLCSTVALTSSSSSKSALNASSSFWFIRYLAAFLPDFWRVSSLAPAPVFGDEPLLALPSLPELPRPKSLPNIINVGNNLYLINYYI